MSGRSVGSASGTVSARDDVGDEEDAREDAPPTAASRSRSRSPSRRSRRSRTPPRRRARRATRLRSSRLRGAHRTKLHQRSERGDCQQRDDEHERGPAAAPRRRRAGATSAPPRTLGCRVAPRSAARSRAGAARLPAARPGSPSTISNRTTVTLSSPPAAFAAATSAPAASGIAVCVRSSRRRISSSRDHRASGRPSRAGTGRPAGASIVRVSTSTVGLGAERARDHRAVRVTGGLLLRQPAGADELADERVVGRELLERRRRGSGRPASRRRGASVSVPDYSSTRATVAVVPIPAAAGIVGASARRCGRSPSRTTPRRPPRLGARRRAPRAPRRRAARRAHPPGRRPCRPRPRRAAARRRTRPRSGAACGPCR